MPELPGGGTVLSGSSSSHGCRLCGDLPWCSTLAGGGYGRLLRELALRQAQLLAELRAHDAPSVPGQDRPTISSPGDVYELLAPEMEPLLQEQLRVLLVDTKHALLEVVTLYQGTVNHVTVRLAELFREAIAAGAPAIVLAHNHPSGMPEPSPDDIAVTRDAAKAGELLGIEVLDHIVIGQGRFESLKQQHYI